VTVWSRLDGLTTTANGCCVVMACSRAWRNVADLRPCPYRFGTPPDRRRHEPGRDRDDQQGDDQLEEGEPARTYL